MSVVVLFYSRYSKASSELLLLMEGSLDFRRLCVDHPEFRQIVLKDSQKYQIRHVPCILVFFANGVVNKYEGEKAFSWTRDTITKMKSILHNTIVPPPNQVHHTPNDSRTTALPFPTTKPPPAKPFTELPLSQPIPVQPVGDAPTEKDLSSHTRAGDMRRHLDSAPLLKKNETTTDMESEAVHQEADATGQNMRGIKSDKQESLLTLAQQMQKERDQEEDMTNRRPTEGAINAPPS